MSDESIHEKELGGKLLASVSRSFYLTLKALPKKVREPISLAYLLARTADTIADTSQAPADTRLECLGRFREIILGSADANAARSLAVVLKGRFCPHQTDEAEARLMEKFADAIGWLRSVKGPQAEAIREVMQPIIRGQTLDIERFPEDGKTRALKNAEQLDEYTWLVAGCVGEFWTRLCLSEMPDAFAAGSHREELIDWGIRFGKGLQLINILRDLPEDIAAGRCYLPEDELKKTGHQLVELKLDKKILDPLRAGWQAKCEEHLAFGLRYAAAIRDGKLRYATALPLLIGARTAALLRTASWQQLSAGVKVTRLEIAKIIAESAIACRKPESLVRLFDKLGK